MNSRKNITELAELGARRRALRAELEQVEADIDASLLVAYPEGWTWNELIEASSLSVSALHSHLSRLGLPATAPRRSNAEDAKEKRAAARKKRLRAPDAQP